MRYLKWFLPLSVAAFPYICLAGLYIARVQFLIPGHPFVPIGLIWLGGLAAALAVLLTRKHWTACELALANRFVKLAHIPAYVFWFAAGILFLFFMGAPLAFFMDVMALSLSGLIGLAAVLRCREEERLAGKAAVLHGVLQFVFCADVFSAIWVYIKIRKEKERLL